MQRGDQVKLHAEEILTTSDLDFFNPEKLFTLNVRDVEFGSKFKLRPLVYEIIYKQVHSSF